jgi:hypothetical protein
MGNVEVSRVRQPMGGAEIYEMHRIRGRDSEGQKQRGDGFEDRRGGRGEWVEAGAADCDRPSETEGGAIHTKHRVMLPQEGMIGGGSRDREQRAISW